MKDKDKGSRPSFLDEKEDQVEKIDETQEAQVTETPAQSILDVKAYPGCKPKICPAWNGKNQTCKVGNIQMKGISKDYPFPCGKRF